MPSPKQIDLIRRTLGPKAVSFDYRLGDAQRKGWYRHFKSKKTWSESTRFVEEHGALFLKNNIRLFVGNGQLLGESIYDLAIALPSLPTINIIELAKTGIHNNPDSNWQFVKTEMQKIMDMCAFEIRFADEAGLHATFLKVPTPKQAQVFSEIISRVSPEVFEGIGSDLEREGLQVPTMNADDDVEMTDFEEAAIVLMTKAKKFRLWWD